MVRGPLERSGAAEVRAAGGRRIVRSRHQREKFAAVGRRGKSGPSSGGANASLLLAIMGLIEESAAKTEIKGKRLPCVRYAALDGEGRNERSVTRS